METIEDTDVYGPFVCFPGVYAETERDIPLEVYPSWTDSRFKEMQSVFGSEGKSLHYIYDDRMRQWDYNKDKLAGEEASKKFLGDHCTARWFEAKLYAYLGKQVSLEHVLVGLNENNGYPVLCFGYREGGVKK